MRYFDMHPTSEAPKANTVDPDGAAIASERYGLANQVAAKYQHHVMAP